MYLDLTGLVRNRTLRRRLPAALQIYGPRVSTAMTRVLDDPRFAAVAGRPFRLRTVIAVAAPWARPHRRAGRRNPAAGEGARAGIRAAAEVQRTSRPPRDLQHRRRSAALRHRRAGGVHGPGVLQMLSPIYAAMFTRAAAIALLAGVATSSEIDETLRGMPHNVTTEMNLALWRLGVGRPGAPRPAAAHSALPSSPPGTAPGTYPRSGLTGSWAGTATRGAAEIDVGVPRWAGPHPGVRRDRRLPAGHRSRTGPGPAVRPGRRGRRHEDRRTGRAGAPHPTGPGPVRRFLLRRARAIAGLRELPKFAWLYAFAEMRSQLLAAGTNCTGAACSTSPTTSCSSTSARPSPRRWTAPTTGR